MSADSASVQFVAKSSLSASLNAEAALSAQLGAGAAVVNDYLIQTEEIEDGHRLTITRGSEVQTLDLKNGAPGSKDAVLYTPQALTTEQQAQARANVGAASAERVNGLKDDIASMNIAEEAELIESINIEEDTLNIVRTLEPDGTPYKFKAVICKCFVKDDVAEGYILIDATLKQKGYDQYDKRNSTYTWANVGKSDISNSSWIIRSAINCGLLETAFYRPSTNAGSPTFVPSFSNKAIIIEEGNFINQIKLIRSTGFKAGSSIIIYGVRA